MKHIYLPLLLVLAACTGTTGITSSGGGGSISSGAPQSGTYPTGLENTCNGERYGTLVGQDATVLERVLIMSQVRIIRPRTVMSQEYIPARINFDIAENNRISRITCG